MRAQQIAAFAIALAATAPVTAHAQSTDTAKPCAVKIGGLFAGKGAEEHTFSGAKDTSNTQAYLGVSYELRSRSQALPIAYGVYFDYIAESRKKANGIYDATAMGAGLGVSGRYLFEAPGRTLTPYLGLGLGIYRLNSRDSLSGLDDVENSDNSYVAGAKFTGGIDTRSGFLAEVSCQTLPGLNGANLSGVMLAVGYRF